MRAPSLVTARAWYPCRARPATGPQRRDAAPRAAGRRRDALAERPGLALGADLEADLGEALAVHVHADGVLADLLDRSLQAHVGLLELEAGDAQEVHDGAGVDR